MFHTNLLPPPIFYSALTSLPHSWGCNRRGVRGSGLGKYYYPAAGRTVRREAHQGKAVALLGPLVPLGTSEGGQAADRTQAEGTLPAEDARLVAGIRQQVGTQAARIHPEVGGSLM